MSREPERGMQEGRSCTGEKLLGTDWGPEGASTMINRVVGPVCVAAGRGRTMEHRSKAEIYGQPRWWMDREFGRFSGSTSA